jgi:hypothetical protein
MSGLGSEVQALSPQAFWAFTGMAALAAGVTFFFLWRSYHRSRLVSDTPTSRVRSAAQGYVELDGRGDYIDGPPTLSPVSGRRCLWYRYKLERREATILSEDNRTRWDTLQQGESDAPFFLDDGTGRVEIHPEEAEVTPRQRKIWCTRDANPNSLRTSLQIGRFALNLGGRYRHTEELLLPGPLYALGWFATLTPSQQPPIDTAVRERLESWQQAEQVFMEQFDTDGDGRLQADERQRARKLARTRVLAERAEQDTAPAFHTLTAPPDGRRPFLLAGHSQRELSARYRNRALASLAGFALATGALLWLLAVRF